jgi:hypothetical protein
MSSTENSDQVGDRTRNLAGYTNGVRPALRRSTPETICPPVAEASLAELFSLRPAAAAVPGPLRPRAGRHRSSARVPWPARIRRVFSR